MPPSIPLILSVDDSLTVRRIIAKAFQSYDCLICEAANGEQGLEMAMLHKPDLIILDVSMPVMDGVTMLGKLKENPELKKIPVIMLTAESSHANVLEIAKIGVRDYLVKPFKKEEIIERVGRIMQLRKKLG